MEIFDVLGTANIDLSSILINLLITLDMSNQARELIGQWRKFLNEYRVNSRTIARQIIQLVEGLDDNDKLQVIDIFGNILFIIMMLILFRLLLMRAALINI